MPTSRYMAIFVLTTTTTTILTQPITLPLAHVCGVKINIIMTLGGEGVLVHDILQLHGQQTGFSCDYTF